MTELIPGASKRVKEQREKDRLSAKFKFWCEIKSGSQIATEFMNIDQASEWLQSVQQNIVGMQVIETMSREEAVDVLKLFNRR